jgi:hypothetical protein
MHSDEKGPPRTGTRTGMDTIGRTHQLSAVGRLRHEWHRPQVHRERASHRHHHPIPAVATAGRGRVRCHCNIPGRVTKGDRNNPAENGVRRWWDGSAPVK